MDRAGTVTLTFESAQAALVFLHAHQYILRHYEPGLAVWEARGGWHLVDDSGAELTWRESC